MIPLKDGGQRVCKLAHIPHSLEAVPRSINPPTYLSFPWEGKD